MQLLLLGNGNPDGIIFWLTFRIRFINIYLLPPQIEGGFLNYGYKATHEYKATTRRKT